MKIAVVILNYNGLAHLQRYLPSVIENTPDAEIWIADNASTDQSIQWLINEHPQIKYVVLSKNHGYAGGYNAALQSIEADFYVLLNSDVEVTKNWLSQLLYPMFSNAKIAAAQPKVLSVNQPDHFEYAGAAGGFIDKYGYPFCRGRIFDDLEPDNGQYNDSKRVFWATGACMAIRADAFHQIGGFDDSFFAHMEEIDLCWRLQKSGYEIWCFPQSEVFHLGGGTLQKSNPHKTFLNFRNGLYMLYKNLDNRELYFTLFVRMVLDGISGLYFLFTFQFSNFWAIIRAHFSFYRSISDLKKKRIPVKLKVSRYNGSIVLKYFLQRIKKYSDL